MKTTKKGKELYYELVKPMIGLAKRNKSLSVKEWSRLRAITIRDIIRIRRRKKPKVIVIR